MTNTSTMASKKENDGLISSSSPFIFVITCMMLAYIYAVPASSHPSEWVDLAQRIYSSSQALWLSLAISILMMYVMGLSPIRNQLAALVVGVIGSLAILAMAAFQIGWLVTMLLLFAVLVPGGSLAFAKLANKAQ